METYLVVMKIRAECKSDAQELILDYTGNETDISLEIVEKIEDGENTWRQR